MFGKRSLRLEKSESQKHYKFSALCLEFANFFLDSLFLILITVFFPHTLETFPLIKVRLTFLLQIRSYFPNWVESNWLNLQNSSWSCLKKVTCLTYTFSISVFEFSNLIEICLQPCEVVKSAQLGLSNTYKNVLLMSLSLAVSLTAWEGQGSIHTYIEYAAYRDHKDVLKFIYSEKAT